MKTPTVQAENHLKGSKSYCSVTYLKNWSVKLSLDGIRSIASTQSLDTVPAHLISYAERLLTQMMGPATARIALNKEFESETIDLFDIQDILQD